MTDTKALYDVVADSLAGQGREAQDALETLMGRLRDAEQERSEDQGVIRVWRGRTERAEVDNAALMAAMLKQCSVCRGDGAPYCSGGVHAFLAQPHPGAALLEEVEGLRNRVKEVEDDLRRSVAMRLEQQTTRDAVLEEAAKVAESAEAKTPGMRVGLHIVAGRIRSLKTGQGA